MRKGFNGLSGIICYELNRDPSDGSNYCFVNKRRDRIKLLLFEGDGFAVYYKILAQGTLELPKVSAKTGCTTITPETLRLILSGVKLSSITQIGKIFARVAVTLRPLYNKLVESIIANDYIQMDESRMPVLSADKPGATHLGQMWLVRDPSTGQVAYRYDRNRAA